jgi:hypothetical protein
MFSSTQPKMEPAERIEPMKAISKKFSLYYFALAGMWGIYLLSLGTAAIGIVLESTIYLSTSEKADMKLVGLLIMIFLLVLAFWRKCTFNKNDFIRIAKKEGIELRSNSLWIRLLTEWISATFKGALGGILVGAKITGPFMVPFGFDYSQSITPDTLYRTDFVELLSPFDIRREITVEIKIGKKEKIIAHTGIQEADAVIDESLYDTKDFHTILSLSSQGLKSTILGSSWLGGRFQARIAKGISMHKKMHEELKKKYTLLDIDAYDLKLNEKGAAFNLLRKN